jgi:hypothetical protein
MRFSGSSGFKRIQWVSHQLHALFPRPKRLSSLDTFKRSTYKSVSRPSSCLVLIQIHLTPLLRCRELPQRASSAFSVPQFWSARIIHIWLLEPVCASGRQHRLSEPHLCDTISPEVWDLVQWMVFTTQAHLWECLQPQRSRIPRECHSARHPRVRPWPNRVKI